MGWSTSKQGGVQLRDYLPTETCDMESNLVIYLNLAIHLHCMVLVVYKLIDSAISMDLCRNPKTSKLLVVSHYVAVTISTSKLFLFTIISKICSKTIIINALPLIIGTIHFIVKPLQPVTLF